MGVSRQCSVGAYCNTPLQNAHYPSFYGMKQLQRGIQGRANTPARLYASIGVC
jgi:hypothetical protein